MDYTNFTREQLLERIEELEILNRELLMEKEQETKLEYAWTGNLGYWYWNVKTNTVTFNSLKVTTLGYDKTEIPEHVTYQFFTDKIHPEDYNKTMDEKNKILAEQAAIDGLTKISNHRILIEELESKIADANRMNNLLSIALFDLDDFKKVNDSRGHIYGDNVLTDIASIIKKNIRETDIAGRYGGEEFMVILPNTDLIKAVNIAERIRKAVENNTFVDGLKMTISGGVKQYEGENLLDFIHSTDMNLYKAKENGKNQIVY